MASVMRAWEKTLPLALVVSAGLHLVAVLALDAPPVGWGQGPAQALQVLLGGEESSVPVAQPRKAGPGALPAAQPYYRKAELDEPAIALSPVPLLIPEYAYHSRLGGRVRARVFIGSDGSVDKVVILEVEPVRGLFEEPALTALRKMRYRPAKLDGRPVRSQKVVDVVFDPRADAPGAKQ